VDPHRVEVLDRAHDDDVVAAIAHHLELELVPAANRLLDEHLPDRALLEPPVHLVAERGRGIDEPAAVAPERERRPDDRRKPEPADILE
jgi:hypothetical protein